MADINPIERQENTTRKIQPYWLVVVFYPMKTMCIWRQSLDSTSCHCLKIPTYAISTKYRRDTICLIFVCTTVKAIDIWLQWVCVWGPCCCTININEIFHGSFSRHICLLVLVPLSSSLSAPSIYIIIVYTMVSDHWTWLLSNQSTIKVWMQQTC